MKLVIVTTCKPFEEDIAWKQEQSMKSWTMLKGIELKIIVVGDDKGVKEICDKYNFIFRPDVKKKGPVPYLVSMLNIAYEYASEDDVVMWTNADMTYGQDLIETILFLKSLYYNKKPTTYLFLHKLLSSLLYLDSRFLCVIITIEALLFFLNGTCIKFLIEILFLENIFVIDDNTPGKGLLLRFLIYEEHKCFKMDQIYLFFF